MIRRAVAADEVAIRFCAEQAYRRYIPLIGRRPAPMEADFASQIASGFVYVARSIDGLLHGFVVFYPQQDHVLLENVAVMSHAIGKGLGKRLVAFCEDEARRRGYGAVRLYTNEKMPESLMIYRRLGYVETGRRVEAGFKRVFFEKDLERPE